MKTLLRPSPACRRLIVCKGGQRRTFLPSLSSISLTAPVQHLSATRTLPYPAPELYKIIADVPSYSTFLPYCMSSKVTRWSGKDNVPSWGREWPEEAELKVGWKGVKETFVSQVFCVPGKIVEAVAGDTGTKLNATEIEHHNRRQDSNPAAQAHTNSEILKHLLTRWTVEPTRSGPNNKTTQVTLSIEYQFANPLYSAMSGAVADKVAGVIIEAFEKRVKEVMHRN